MGLYLKRPQSEGQASYNAVPTLPNQNFFE